MSTTKYPKYIISTNATSHLVFLAMYGVDNDDVGR